MPRRVWFTTRQTRVLFRFWRLYSFTTNIMYLLGTQPVIDKLYWLSLTQMKFVTLYAHIFLSNVCHSYDRISIWDDFASVHLCWIRPHCIVTVLVMSKQQGSLKSSSKFDGNRFQNRCAIKEICPWNFSLQKLSLLQLKLFYYI